MRSVQREFEGNIGALNAVSEFLEDFMKDRDLHERTAFAVQLAVEEIFVNIVKYNEGPIPPVQVGLEADEDRVTVFVRATGVKPFDIRQVKPYNTTLPVSMRPAGGMGIHLVNTVMDRVGYQHHDGITVITLVKNVEKRHVQNRSG